MSWQRWDCETVFSAPPSIYSSAFLPLRERGLKSRYVIWDQLIIQIRYLYSWQFALTEFQILLHGNWTWISWITPGEKVNGNWNRNLYQRTKSEKYHLPWCKIIVQSAELMIGKKKKKKKNKKGLINTKQQQFKNYKMRSTRYTQKK